MNIGIYIYDQAEVLDFSGPFEVFSTASRVCTDAAPFDVFLVSETDETVVARAGLLHGRKVTTHWDDIADLRNMFPQLDVIENVRWVDQGDLLTSGGISAGIDMSLHLVSKLHSQALAQSTARQMEFAWTKNED